VSAPTQRHEMKLDFLISVAMETQN
jgi:hypothetical protein